MTVEEWPERRYNTGFEDGGGQELKCRDEQQNLEKARKWILLWDF